MAETRRWAVGLSPRRVSDSTWERRIASRGFAAEDTAARRARARRREVGRGGRVRIVTVGEGV